MGLKIGSVLLSPRPDIAVAAKDTLAELPKAEKRLSWQLRSAPAPARAEMKKWLKEQMGVRRED